MSAHVEQQWRVALSIGLALEWQTPGSERNIRCSYCIVAANRQASNVWSVLLCVFVEPEAGGGVVGQAL